MNQLGAVVEHPWGHGYVCVRCGRLTAALETVRRHICPENRRKWR